MIEYHGHIEMNHLHKDNVVFVDHRRKYIGDRSVLTYSFKDGDVKHFTVTSKDGELIFKGDLYIYKSSYSGDKYTLAKKYGTSERYNLSTWSIDGYSVVIKSKEPLFDKKDIDRGEAAYQREFQMIREAKERKNTYLSDVKDKLNTMDKDQIIDLILSKIIEGKESLSNLIEGQKQ